MGVKYIITDNDGVNIDSEDVAMRVMDDWGMDFVRKLNAVLPKDFIYTTYPGTSTNKIVEALIEKFGMPAAQSIEDYNIVNPSLDELSMTGEKRAALTLKEKIGFRLADIITLETNRRFQAELKSISGTTQAWIKIRKIVGSENIALATTSRTDRMDICLAHAVDPDTGENARLDEMFPKGPQRRSGYGHSNKYDEAFAALGWDPNQTVIVEDSISGVTKAKAGRSETPKSPGTPVIGTVAARFYTDKGMQAEALLEAGADIVILDMTDLPLAIKWLRDGKPETHLSFNSPAFIRSTRPRAQVSADPISVPSPK